MALDLRVRSLCPTLGVEITYIDTYIHTHIHTQTHKLNLDQCVVSVTPPAFIVILLRITVEFNAFFIYI